MYKIVTSIYFLGNTSRNTSRNIFRKYLKKEDIQTDVLFVLAQNCYKMMDSPVMAAGFGRPRIWSMVGAMSASLPSRSLQSP